MKRPNTILLSGLAMLLLFGGTVVSAQSGVKLVRQPEKNRVQVRIDGDLFTNYVVNEYPMPVLYPIHGPDGIRMNRQYPMKEGVDGESDDHPHHKSLMYSHGKLNGVDFWHQGGPKTVHSEFLKLQDNVIKTRNRWVDNDGDEVLTDTRKMTFQSVPGGRAIDYEITLHASEGNLDIGDTKEGTMAIRTHPNLRIDRGAHAVNSNGTEGKPIWGESAKWVHYSDKIDGEEVGVAVFDHPSNPRHPTTWHAREYGLITANPFGYSHYKGNSHDGSMTIQEDGDVTFSYRFLFIRGDHQDANIEKRYRRYASNYTPSYVPDEFDLQFSEHFVEEDAIHRFVFSSPGDWSREPIRNGARHVLQQGQDGETYSPPHRSPRHIGLVKRPQVNSFLLDFDTKQIGRSYGHMDACVFYNFVNPANFYYTHMAATRDNHAHQTFIVDDAPRTAITDNQGVEKSVDWTDREWHHIRVIRNGTTGEIDVYIDDMDEPEMTATDTTHGSGRIGFGSFDDRAQFKNIQLYAPIAKRGMPDFFQGKNPISILPAGRQFYHPLEVTIDTPEGLGDELVVRYTTDGTNPGAASRAYDGPVTIESSTTLKAATFRKGNRVSGVTTASYEKLTEDEYKSSLKVRELNVKTGASYDVVYDGIESGDRVYVDRSYTYKNVPDVLDGATFVRTANDDSSASGTVLQFRTNSPSTVYVALDERASTPAWLDESFERTDHVLHTTDVPFRLYRKTFPAGTIRLGGNNAPSMYQVFLNKPSK